MAVLWLSHHHSQLYVVESVLDGDTFAITYRGEGRLVQLAGADAPEIHKNEPLAEEVRDYLERRIKGKRVRLQFLDAGDPLDYKQRLLCWAWIDGENISHTLVRKGYARFSGAAERRSRNYLVGLEDQARADREGIWQYRVPREDLIEDGKSWNAVQLPGR